MIFCRGQLRRRDYACFMDPAWVGAIGSVGSAAVGAGAIAWSAHSFKRTNENTSRPYVSVSFEAVDRDDRVYFKIGNYGQSAAMNITIEFSSQLSEGIPSDRDFGAYLRAMFKEPGITLSPGEYKQTIYQVPGSSQQPTEKVAPDQLHGTISYRAPAKFSRRSGKVKKQGKGYVEGFSLDVGPLKHMLRVSRSDRDIEQRILKLTQEVGKLVSTVKESKTSVNTETSLAEHRGNRARPHKSCFDKIRNALVDIRFRR